MSLFISFSNLYIHERADRSVVTANGSLVNVFQVFNGWYLLWKRQTATINATKRTSITKIPQRTIRGGFSLRNALTFSERKSELSLNIEFFFILTS
jgi:hypothetical protein